MFYIDGLPCLGWARRVSVFTTRCGRCGNFMAVAHGETRLHTAADGSICQESWQPFAWSVPA